MTQPEYLSQGVNYLGFLSQKLGDLRGITTLAHELIQNADDAKDDAGKRSATRITFDVRDDALVVSNDAVFKDIDFNRMREVASGSKRYEGGDRTTGAFGVGFISVYQVTDRPEILSSGRHWILRPEEREDQRIAQFRDPSITKDKGTVFRLPWAFKDTSVRQRLKVPPLGRDSIDSFTDDLMEALPKAILFLKKLDTIKLLRNGKPIGCVTRVVDGNRISIDCDGVRQNWRIIEGDFASEASKLKLRFSMYIDTNREDCVRIAIPDVPLNDGLLFATLPTEQTTGLPFHVDADFFPTSDRKSIAFEDSYDHRSEWNRAIIGAAASAVGRNLIPLRDMFKQDAIYIWAILSRLENMHREHMNNGRKRLGAFWEKLLPSLRTSPIVYAESGKWLTPDRVRITTGSDEKAAVPVFTALDIEIVHQDLDSYRNILMSKQVGVRPLSVVDIHEALIRVGMVGQVLSEDTSPLQSNLLRLLWEGIPPALQRAAKEDRQQALELLKQCTLAPAVDGHLWPCGLLYKADEETRHIFLNLVREGVSFLAERGIRLLEEENLCGQFGTRSAISELESLHTEGIEFQAGWHEGRFDPVAVLRWFDTHKRDLIEHRELRRRLVRIPIFPSADGNLRPLSELWIPGGFKDPLGVADLLDMERLAGLSDFLRSLGARGLTLTDYADRYITAAFSPESNVGLKAKRQLLDILTRHIGEIKENSELRKKLARTNIVECTGPSFRQPNEVYFRSDRVWELFDNSVDYAYIPKKITGRADLYQWLGVESSPRPHDVISSVNELTTASPNQTSKQTITKILEVIGETFPHLPDDVKKSYSSLQTKLWLPSESDPSRYYRASELYAAYNKSLFESQAQFLDVPYRVQQNINDFLLYLGVNLSPYPRQVVNHLLECAKNNAKPPKGIYQWLNDNARKGDIRDLLRSACLRVNGRYLQPDQVFWGKHPFGRFRERLGEDFQSYRNLLLILGVKESPDHKDAIQVLKELSVDIGSTPLESDDKDVVLQCWVLLSEALEQNTNNDRYLEDAFPAHGFRNCVPNTQDLLQSPHRMFFEDRPGLVDKLPDQFRHNTIKRIERAWVVMNAAGVRPISEVVRGYIDDPVDSPEDYELKNRVEERTRSHQVYFG